MLALFASASEFSKSQDLCLGRTSVHFGRTSVILGARRSFWAHVGAPLHHEYYPNVTGIDITDAYAPDSLSPRYIEPDFATHLEFCFVRYID